MIARYGTYDGDVAEVELCNRRGNAWRDRDSADRAARNLRARGITATPVARVEGR